MAMATGCSGFCSAFSNMAAMARCTWSILSMGLLYIGIPPVGRVVGLDRETGIPGSVGMVRACVKRLRHTHQGQLTPLVGHSRCRGGDVFHKTSAASQ